MSQAEDTEHGRCQATAKSTGNQCGRPAVGEHGKCGYHGGKSTGAPENNTNAQGHEGAETFEEGHFDSLKTGDNVAADRWIEFVEEEASEEFKTVFRGHFERFRERDADPAIAVRLAVMWSKADYNNMELLKEDFMRPMYHEGEYVDDVFDSERDSSALSNEREARQLRREDMLSPNSRDSDVAGGLESIADVIAEVSDS